MPDGDTAARPHAKVRQNRSGDSVPIWLQKFFGIEALNSGTSIPLTPTLRPVVAGVCCLPDLAVLRMRASSKCQLRPAKNRCKQGCP